jgi:Cupin superfamily protein
MVHPDDILVPNRGVDDVICAMKDFSSSSSSPHDASHDNGEDDYERGLHAWNFLTSVAHSTTFIQDYWQKRPFLIRAKDTTSTSSSTSGCGWIQDCFTIERDLRLMDGSYITGFKTAEILRNGTKTDTWALSPLKDDPTRTTQWSDVEDALRGGTIYFNTAGSLWSNLGGLCRLFGYAFGLPPNVNVYCTPPSCSLSVPLHTDKQDVFVFQSQGTKRWRIYAPPPRSSFKGGIQVDPLARGKNGDVLSLDELEPPLIDTVIHPGDVLYVPTGFPHTTDTVTTPVVEGGGGATAAVASVHLTMGLDTHVWFLALAHLRWSLLQRCGKTYNADLTDDSLYWKAMGSIPFGFLGGPAWRLTVKSIQEGHGVGADFKAMVADQLLDVLVRMEPKRWKETSEDGPESLPTREQIDETIEYFVAKHWKALMETQEELFKDVDARKEESLMKAFRGTQEQNQIMEDFGWFSNNKAFAESFRSRRLINEQRAQLAAQQ